MKWESRVNSFKEQIETSTVIRWVLPPGKLWRLAVPVERLPFVYFLFIGVRFCVG